MTTLYWANGMYGNSAFATMELLEGQYIWKWLIDDPKKVLESFFRLMFCTQCGEQGQDEIIAQTDDMTKYSISQLRNLFFNCGIVVRKSK
jgi:hypothetical protein|tara:strand:+ start:549 stop:818 length:270 start_codon:yes stop_codon:yes gene_type:complete